MANPEDAAFEELMEAHNILIRAARRCAYDLRHAAALIDKDHWSDLKQHLRRNAEHWVALFQSGNSVKDYQIQLHHEIEIRDRKILELKNLLRENGIDPQEF